MFDSKFTKMGQDSLAEAARTAMQDGDLRRKAEAQVNEQFGVYSRKAVVREQLAAYDAALAEAYKCMKEGKPLDPVGKEDGDVDNDGDKDKSDKYLLNRRKTIGRAMGKKMEEGKKMWEAEDTGTSEPSDVSKQAGAKQEKETPAKDYSRTQMDNLVKNVVKEALGPKQTPRYPAVEKIAANKVKGQPLPSETRHPNPGAVTRVAGQQALAEKAPPGAKMERMVKHIKKGYAADGELTKKEKGIAYATAWKSYGKHKKGLKEETVSLEEANESFAAFVAEAINTFALAEHPEATVENLHMFNEAYVVACLDEAYACSEKKMKKHKKMKKDLEEAAEAFGKEKEEKGEKKHKEGKSEEAKEKAKKVLAKLKESRSFNSAQETGKPVNEAESNPSAWAGSTFGSFNPFRMGNQLQTQKQQTTMKGAMDRMKSMKATPSQIDAAKAAPAAPASSGSSAGQTFSQAYAAARKAGGSKAQFSWTDPKTGKVGTFQAAATKKEYVPMSQQTKVDVTPKAAPASTPASAPAAAPQNPDQARTAITPGAALKAAVPQTPTPNIKNDFAAGKNLSGATGLMGGSTPPAAPAKAPETAPEPAPAPAASSTPTPPQSGEGAPKAAAPSTATPSATSTGSTPAASAPATSPSDKEKKTMQESVQVGTKQYRIV